MFNLEQSIAGWRQQMLTAGIQTPVPLEELEIHLREEIERQIKSGLGAQQAFEIAEEKVGPASELNWEFKKIGAPMKITKIIKLAGVICLTVSLFCPLFIFLPMLLDHRLSSLPKLLAVAVYAITVVTSILSWRYNHKLLPVIHNQLFRRAVGLACYGGCLLWIRFGIFHFPPGGPSLRSLLLPAFIFGMEWTVMAILGGVGHGLEKAAYRQTALMSS